jgi:hypothetical protein
MKTLSIITVAIFLGAGGVAMANDSGENHQDNTNATGPNPFMTFSDPYKFRDPSRTFSNYQGGGTDAFAMQPVRHHVVKHHVKK